MKTVFTLFAFLLISILPSNAQSTFNSDEYKLFLEKNKNISSTDILENNPRHSTYFSQRQHPTSLSDVCWFDSINERFAFTKYEKELLSNNHFMTTERLSRSSWAQAFIDIYSNDLPLFLSSDFILHTLHSSYDDILKNIELNILDPNLKTLLQAMHAQFDTVYSNYANTPSLKDALNDVDLYLAVANSLINNSEILPRKTNRAEYDKVMTAINAEKMTTLPLFTAEKERILDFSQFKVRGHYDIKDGDEMQLRNYFKSMMWLGRIDFLLTAPPNGLDEPTWTTEELKRMQMGALLLNEIVESCGKTDLLHLHEKIISFMVGPDDNLSPKELSGIVSKLNITPDKIANTDTYTVLTKELNSSDDYGQKIMSNFFKVNPNTTTPDKLPVSYKLLGQKFLLDSYITSEVVYDRINWNGTKVFRGLPDPLDAMAVLGNQDALELVKGEMEQYHYAYKVNALQELISKYDNEFWGQSMYNTWLSAIRTLNPHETTDNLPYFMQTTAWRHQKLNTQLFSWAELRHDNLLYGKQSYTGGTSCSYPYSYVEPQAKLYQKISEFSSRAKVFFNEAIGADNKVSLFYNRYGQIIDTLALISEKELQKSPLNDKEIIFLKTMINEYMSSGPSITGWYNDLFFSWGIPVAEDFIIADIHTQPTDATGNIVGNVLHVGTGLVNYSVVLAPNPMNPKHLVSYIGPVGSFHHYTSPNFNRLSDAEWGEKFAYDNTEIRPERPDWVSNFLANSEGNKYTKGRELSGATYISSGLDNTFKRDLDYLIAFPNPAQNSVHLRFVLNQSKEVQIKITDLLGRNVIQLKSKIYLPGEHDIPISTDALNTGNYVIQFTYGDKKVAKALVIK